MHATIMLAICDAFYQVEATGNAGGHFLAQQHFTYIPVNLGKCAWIQSDATLHAGCTMEERSRVLPGANVLPGQTLQAGSVCEYLLVLG
jgi:hypothetical protein